MFLLLQILLGMWVALMSVGLVLLISDLIVIAFSVPEGATFRRLTYLGFSVEKDLYAEDPAKRGKLRIKKFKFAPFPDLLIDCYWPEEKNKKVGRKVNTVTCIVLAAIVALLTYAVIAIPNNYARAVFIGMLTTFGFFFIAIPLSKPLSKGKKNEFATFLEKKIREIRDGGSIENVDLPPLHELPVQTEVDFYKWRYLRLRHLKAEMTNDLKGIAENIYMIERLTDTKLPILARVSRNACLMDYYAYRQKNYTKATEYYNSVKEQIEKDMDCNGRRTLGYYSYFVLGDKEKARKCVEQGLSALTVEDPMRMPIETEYEEKMLLYLKRLLDEEEKKL